MPRISMTFRSFSRGVFAPAMVVTCAGSLVGCDQSGSEASAKIEEAARTITHVSPTTPGDERAAAFSKASGTLRDLSSNENAKDAASVITAQATAGTAQVALERAQRLGSEVLSSVSAMRRELQTFVNTSARLEGLEAQDFSDEYASLDSEASRLSDALDAERSRLAGIEAELERLAGEREQRADAARELRVRVVELKRSVQDASATERQPVLDEALRVSRQADGLDSEASRLQIQLDDARQRSRATASEIALLEQQRENNAGARATTQKLERQVRQQRDELRGESQSMARALLERFELAAGDYESGAKASYDEAAQGFSRAAGEASRGSGVPGARMSAANIRLLEASAYVHRAGVERALAAIGSDLIAVVPNASSIGQRVEALLQDADEALESAAGAYDSASAVLDSAGERADEIRAMLGGDDPMGDGSMGDGSGG